MRQMDFVGGSGPATDDADVPELNAAAFHPTEDDIFARIATR